MFHSSLHETRLCVPYFGLCVNLHSCVSSVMQYVSFLVFQGNLSPLFKMYFLTYIYADRVMTTENFDTQREVCYTNTCLSCAYKLKCDVNVFPFLALRYVTVLCLNKHINRWLFCVFLHRKFKKTNLPIKALYCTIFCERRPKQASIKV